MAPVRSASDTNIEKLQITDEVPSKIALGAYIFNRIKQVGVQSIFGVPGDFNLSLLEHIYSINDLKWVGCLNELNSAYAADGYARYSNKLGVVITTFGVGELSAINGISGAFAEYVPVLHIVGTSPTNLKEIGQPTHHLVPSHSSLEPSDHHTYEKMIGSISCAAESIKDANKATYQVDRLIEAIVKNSKPGYLFLPSDLADIEVDSELLNYPLNFIPTTSDVALEDKIVDDILSRLYEAENPNILGDVLTDRFHLTSSLRELVHKTGIPNYASSMGKSILNEAENSFIASYNGVESNTGVKECFESADLVLHVGNFENEINTGHYSINVNPLNKVTFNNEYIKIGKDLYKGVNFQTVLPKIVSKIDLSKLQTRKIKENLHIIKSKLSSTAIKDANTSTHTTEITQVKLLNTMQKYLSEDDVLICETGSFQFGVPDLKFPSNVKYISQGFYLSIGYALPACLGVGVAMKDFDLHQKRLILVEGDGSAQMTIQEFGTYLNEKIQPQIFLLNNSGYTVERLIKGPTRSYNDISPNWKWCDIFRVFGDYERKHHECFEIDTIDQLDSLVHLSGEDKLRLFEVKLDPMDVPWRFGYMTNKH